MRKPRGYWTYERCKEEAIVFNNRTDFQKHSVGAYTKSLNNKWIDDICSHMLSTQKPTGYWTYDRCKEEALKYKYKSDFQKKSSSAFNSVIKNNWMKNITDHLLLKQKTPPNHWTKDRCKEEALKCKTRTGFSNMNNSAYGVATKNGWLDDICIHMSRMGNRYNKCIYSYEFPDNHVYIGLTYNLEKRHKNRSSNDNDQVTKHIKKTGLIPLRTQLTDYIYVDDAVKLEDYYVKEYNKHGWVILNIAKTGGIGGSGDMWTYDRCKEETLKYKSRSELRINNGSVYTIVNNKGWLELYDHMTLLRHNSNHWTFKRCKEEALKYKSRSEYKSNNSSYNFALKNGWLDGICSHMIERKKPSGYWTYNRCKEEALKYNTISELIVYSLTMYTIISKNKWLDGICSHMIERKKPSGYWTYDRCKEEALKYKYRTDFNNNSKSAYSASYRNKWLDDICSHMVRKNKK